MTLLAVVMVSSPESCENKGESKSHKKPLQYGQRESDERAGLMNIPARQHTANDGNPVQGHPELSQPLVLVIKEKGVNRRTVGHDQPRDGKPKAHEDAPKQQMESRSR